MIQKLERAHKVHQRDGYVPLSPSSGSLVKSTNRGNRGKPLQQSADYAHIDDWADFLLTDSAHASRSRHTSHNRLAFCLSNLAACAGLASSALQPDVPVAEEVTNRLGDIVTSVAGLSRSSTYRFSSQTQLITDVTITHLYTWTNDFKPNSLRDAEALKNRLSGHGFRSARLQLLWPTGPPTSCVLT